MKYQKLYTVLATLLVVLVGGYVQISWLNWHIRETAREVVIEELENRGLIAKPGSPAQLVLELRTPKPDCMINRVVDADTLKVDVQLVGDVWLKNASMRIANIDAIELKDTGGPEAAAWVREFVSQPGCQVYIEKQRDKYGRLLGDVEHNGKNLSDLLLEKNYAKPYDN